MAKVILIDEEKNRELLSKYLNNINNIEILFECQQFEQAQDYFKDAELVVFDVNSKNENEILAQVKLLKKVYPCLKFIAISYEINSQLVTKALNEGADDFLLKPILADILEESIKKINSTTKKARTICAFSTKGGVGKTSTLINLAYEIWNNTKEKVCILDFGNNNEDVIQFLNIKEKTDTNCVLVNLEKSNKEILLSMMNKYKNTDIYILEIQDNLMMNVKYSADEVLKIINSLKNIFDYIFVDTSAMINEENVALLSASDIILLFSQASLASLKQLQRSCELFDKIGYSDDKIKILINRYLEKQDMSINEIEQIINKKVFNVIPNNYLTIVDAINQGASVSELNPQSNIAKQYQKIAQDILKIDFLELENSNKIKYNHGIFNLLRRMGE